MKEKITNLRLRIDGLAQLVKSTGNQPVFIIDRETIPPDMTLKEVTGSLHLKKDVAIDGLKYEKHVPPVPYPMANCYTSLLLAKAWLGKVLAAIGEDTPYKNDGNRKDVKDIEAPADTQDWIQAADIIMGWEAKGLNYIQKIDWLREEIKSELSNDFAVLYKGIPYMPSAELKQMNVLFDYVFFHLTEARFHLGFELGRIKEESDGQQ